MSQLDAYDEYVREWKRSHGIADPSPGKPDVWEVMQAEDNKSTRCDYCMGCGERFKIAEMKLVSDPHYKFDDRPDREDEYIAKRWRVRMCHPCHKENYPEDEEA